MKPRPPSGGRGFFVVLLQAILILALGPVLLEAGTALFQTGSIEVGDVRAAPTPPERTVITSETLEARR